jgi:hypothetical protein
MKMKQILKTYRGIVGQGKIVKPAERAVARQWLNSNRVITTTDTNSTLE